MELYILVLSGVIVAALLPVTIWLAVAARARERARAASEAELRDVLDHAVDAMEITAADGRLLYVNHAWLEMFGYRGNEWATEGSETMVIPAHAEAYRAMRERLLRGDGTAGEPAHVGGTFEGVCVTRSAQRIVVAVRANVKRENGRPVALRSILRDVTAQRKVEEAQARLVATFEATTDFVCVTTRAGRTEYINRAGRRMVGVDAAADPASVDLAELFAPGARRHFTEVALPAALRDGAWEGESTIRAADGREIPVSVVIVAHESARGGVWFLSTIMRDMTAQHRRERELVVVIETAKAMSQAADVRDACRIAIECLCAATHWPYAEVWIPSMDRDAMDRAAVWHRAEAHLDDFADAMGRFHLPRGQGLPGRVWETRRPVWIRDLTDVENNANFVRTAIVASSGLRAAVGVPVMAGDEVVAALAFHMYGPTDDDEFLARLAAVVAEPLGMMIVRKRAEEALRESEQRFHRLSDASTDGISVSRGGVALEVNTAWCRLFGYDEAEARVLPPYSMVVPRDRATVMQAVTEGWHHTYEVAALRSDGTTFDAQITGSDITYKGSAARITVVRDITDWKRVDRMKSEFVSTVSHELRTPLTAIRGSLGLLEGGVVGPLTARAGELVRIAVGNTDRLIRLINDMLDLDKMAAGKLELRRVSLTPADIIRVAVDGIRAMAEQYDIRLVERVTALRAVEGDPDRVLQVLTNLLSNAIKFAPAGSTIEISATDQDAGRSSEPAPPAPHAAGAEQPVIRFAVENPGPGIAPAEMDRLFRRFQQLDSSDTRRRGGTGLGLAISKAIVEQHGGAIGAESEPGKTVFWFELPVLPFAACTELLSSP
jgi:PAS domain S-box-containing protein